MKDGAVEIQGIEKTYRRGNESLHVLAGLNLSVSAGDHIAIMGPSGSGKTTLLNMIGGLDRPDAGTIHVGATEVTALGGSALAAWRSRHVGFVFQSFNLLPVLTALENVELPLLLQPLSGKERRQHAEYALEIVGLKDRMKHRPKQLSGGQEQRAAIARALVTDPSLVLADEPTGDLDRESAAQVLDVVARLSADHGKTVMMVTHDPLAAETASRVISLEKGTYVEGGVA